jgi:hypothetical protein
MPPGFAHRTVAVCPGAVTPSSSRGSGRTSIATNDSGPVVPAAACRIRGGLAARGSPSRATSSRHLAVTSKSRSVESGPVAVSSARADAEPVGAFTASADSIQASAAAATARAVSRASAARAAASRAACRAAPATSRSHRGRRSMASQPPEGGPPTCRCSGGRISDR